MSSSDNNDKAKKASANPRETGESNDERSAGVGNGSGSGGDLLDEKTQRASSSLDPNSLPGAVRQGGEPNIQDNHANGSSPFMIEKKARANGSNPNSSRQGEVGQNGTSTFMDEKIARANGSRLNGNRQGEVEQNGNSAFMNEKKARANGSHPNGSRQGEGVQNGGVLDTNTQPGADFVSTNSGVGMDSGSNSNASQIGPRTTGGNQQNQVTIQATAGVDSSAIPAVLADQHIDEIVEREREPQTTQILQQIPLVPVQPYVEPRPESPTKPWYKKPLFIIAVIVAIGISIAVPVILRDDDDDEVTREDFLMEILKTISDQDTLTNEKTSQYQATQWLLNEDPMDLVGDVMAMEVVQEQDLPSEQLIERYATVLLYFSTGGPFNWTNQYNFLSNSSICDWNTGPLDVSEGIQITDGVDCNQFGLVKQIFLTFNNLVGTLPDELSVFSNLETLWVSGNELSGTLPVALSKNRHLERISVERNFLNGTLPNLAGLSKLDTLELALNLFTGIIPSWLTRSFPDLIRLGLYGNMFTGTIPDFGALIELEWLFLFDNHLNGPIPASLSQVSNVNLVLLQGNSLTGTIPTSLGRLSRLNVLHLFYNKLTGTIPTELGQLTDLWEFVATGNQLTGPIPTEINSVQHRLFLEGNNLEGNLTEFCYGDPGIPESLLDFSTDCLPDLNSTKLAEVTCPCCSVCCNDDTGCVSNLPSCADTATNLLAKALERYEGDYGTECTCYDDGKQVACKDTKCMFCGDKDECYVDDGPGIGFNLETGTHFLQIRYVQGRNEKIGFNFTGGPEMCIPMINGEQCNSCQAVSCTDGYETFAIDCTNLGYGTYSACDVNDDPFHAIWDIFTQFYRLQGQLTLPTRLECVPYLE